jgi:hypothetical protein
MRWSAATKAKGFGIIHLDSKTHTEIEEFLPLDLWVS